MTVDIPLALKVQLLEDFEKEMLRRTDLMEIQNNVFYVIITTFGSIFAIVLYWEQSVLKVLSLCVYFKFRFNSVKSLFHLPWNT